ncbi:unnamed protein product [Clonostachys rosea]|uniref:F-box domain-containing protein n=1 Tax=Bionectria ochroleuca TaxID=29856 RepID=A0ABY6UTT9_BIOOC|nr:unnamed protein product [Clonostachys rosea]
MPVTLLSLSQEVLVHIVEKLCFHCAKGEASEDDDGWMRMMDKIMDKSDELFPALCNLSLTCKTLRRIALPVLYHGPVMYQNDQVGIARLVRVFTRSPHLAVVARQVDFQIEGRTFFEPSSEWQIAFLESEMKRYAVDDEGRPITIQCDWNSSPWSDDEEDGEESSDVDMDDEDDVEQRPLFMPGAPLEADRTLAPDDYARLLFLAKAQHLEKLADFTPHKDVVPKLSFPNLTFLSLKHWNGDNYNGNGIGGDLDTTVPFLKAAPALRVFHAKVFSAARLQKSEIYHANVTTLDFGECIFSPRAMANIMNGFPKVSRLSYSMHEANIYGLGHDVWADPGELAEALFIRSDTLVYISIEMSKYGPGDEPENDAIDRLGGMAGLKTLRWSGEKPFEQYNRPKWRTGNSGRQPL